MDKINPAQPLIELHNISKKYTVKSKSNLFAKKQLCAVNELNLAIYPGEVLGLVGESGCGKSTTGHMLAGLISPTSGSITYCGDNAYTMNAAKRRKMRQEIQIALQDPYASLNPKHKIGWTIEEPLKIHYHYDKSTRRHLVEEMMDTVGLDANYLTRYPHELSGGQRQRVNIAAALMLNSRLLIADEVVSALDVSIQSQILNLLKSLQKTKQLTYLFISHDLNVVQYMSDRIGVMYLGQLVEIGTVDDVYGSAAHPYTQALLSTIPSLDETPKERIILGGEVPSLLNPQEGCAFHTRCRHATDICRKQCPQMHDTGNGHFTKCHLAT
ncbi:MAG: oligopeptide/dipeptide ABC transporter ATP-binding protein [Anaerocolumna sp.]